MFRFERVTPFPIARRTQKPNVVFGSGATLRPGNDVVKVDICVQHGQLADGTNRVVSFENPKLNRSRDVACDCSQLTRLCQLGYIEDRTMVTKDPAGTFIVLFW